MDIAAAKGRLVTMIAIDVVCGLIAAAAAYGAFVRGVDWAVYLVVAAVAIGLAAQIWFVVGLRAAKEEG